MQSQRPPSDPREELRRLGERVERLERYQRHDATYRGFGPAYAACAAALTIVSFLPLYVTAADKERGIRWSYGSIWEVLDQDDSGVAAIGMLLIVGLVGLLAVASFAQITRAIGLLISISVIGVLLAVLVVAKPATPDLEPAIGHGGQAGIVIVLAAAAIAAVHTLLLVRDRANARRLA